MNKTSITANNSGGMNNTKMSEGLGMNGRDFTFFVIFIAILGGFSSLVNDMYLPTMPAMKHEFHTTTSMVQLGLSMAMIGMGVGAVLLGTVSDHRGRKPVLIFSMVTFVAATAVLLFSHSIQFFIVCRFFQGFGAGGPMVLSTSIPADECQGRQLAKVMAAVGAINGIAPAAGPLLGGFLADDVGWRGIFIVLLAVGLIMGYFVLRMKETLPPSERAPKQNLRSLWQRYKSLLSNHRFMIYVMLKSLGIAMLYAYISSAPFIMQEHYGFSSLTFGLIFGGNALAIGIGSVCAMRFKVLKQGLVIGTIGMFGFAVFCAIVMFNSDNFLLYELSAVPMLLFSGMIFSSANTLAMDVGRTEAGTASAILSIIKYLLAGIVSPLVGLGSLMHTTAIVFVVVGLAALAFVYPAIRLAPLADMKR
ncbi:MAG: multidrug effflux MFS transporter [Muribaculum sp.]|nr:multidrug effflux MFS transporter [Muribaculum sp.]